MIIKRPLPNAVTYDLSSSAQTTITLPTGSSWKSGLHWHEHHVEYLRVVRGRVRVRLGDTVSVHSAASDEVGPNKHKTAEIRISKNMRHEWSRAEFDGEDVVVVERTEPADGEKAIFFWNLNGVILDGQEDSEAQMSELKGGKKSFAALLQRTVREVWVILNVFVIFRALDNFPVLVGFPEPYRALDRVLTHLILRLVGILAGIWRIEPVRRRYTPEFAFRKWEERTKRQRKQE
ncbi:hypothetical protein B0J12DRAFT_560169 [Macrophomina phaseolina]|uniref:Cupin RmlC-type n=1 Tax=Macrophomina phaseolina TaxID=35725 RepID=A0ABQ8GXA5_9PEZI|nr:hypothetical protein B0J12DRAFT_560169 [Macrophomina phaseolina]